MRLKTGRAVAARVGVTVAAVSPLALWWGWFWVPVLLTVPWMVGCLAVWEWVCEEWEVPPHPWGWLGGMACSFVAMAAWVLNGVYAFVHWFGGLSRAVAEVSNSVESRLLWVGVVLAAMVLGVPLVAAGHGVRVRRVVRPQPGRLRVVWRLVLRLWFLFLVPASLLLALQTNKLVGSVWVVWFSGMVVAWAEVVVVGGVLVVWEEVERRVALGEGVGGVDLGEPSVEQSAARGEELGG